MSFSKRTAPTNVDLAGFWTRTQGETLTGRLVKFVPNNKDAKHVRPFFIVQVTVAGPTISVADEAPKKGKKVTRDERAAEVGEYVGVAANYALTSTLDISKDGGKVCRLTISGTAPNPNGPVPMILIDVEVDDDESAPF
jgi:hypothetical protein